MPPRRTRAKPAPDSAVGVKKSKDSSVVSNTPTPVSLTKAVDAAAGIFAAVSRAIGGATATGEAGSGGLPIPELLQLITCYAAPFVTTKTTSDVQ